MKKVINYTFLMLISLSALMTTVFQFIRIDSKVGFTNLIDNSWLVMISSIVIIGFFLYKSYIILTKFENRLESTFLLTILLTLSLLLMINAITSYSGNYEEYITFSAVFRIFCLFGLILSMDSFLLKKQDFRSLVIMLVVTIFAVSLVFIFAQAERAQIMTSYYFIVVMYLVSLNVLTHVNKISWTKIFAYYLILTVLVNDMLLMNFDIMSLELSFTGIAVSLIVIYTEQLIKRYKALKNIETSNVQLLKENKRLNLEKERTLKSVELLKSDLSYKFMRKQNYFENLELAVEVLDSSLIVINDQFKVDLAYGNLLEISGIEDMTGLDVSKALFDISSDEGQYFKSVVGKTFNAVDEVRENLYLSLLDRRLRISNIIYDMNYHVMKKRNGKKVLIVHAELVSEHTQQGAIMARDKEISDMVITVSKNSEMFFSDLASYIEFCKSVHKIIDKNLDLNENIFKVLRRIHTYKGVFDQYNMKSTVRGLNDIENELFNMLHNRTDLLLEQFTKVIMGYDLENLLNSDIVVINDKLGKPFLENKKRITVDLTSFNRLLLKMSEAFGESHELITEMETLKHIDVKEVIKSYAPYVERIAHEQSKEVRFVVTGDSVRVSRSSHINFFESLIHILKNSVGHGVEYPDERIAKGKNSCAEIRCHVKAFEDHISILLSDDGRGIDIKEIKNRLFILGKYAIDELDDLPDALICNMIIEDGITSTSMPNSLSGRGVGMGSIKDIVNSIGGEIHVTSKSGEGVSYEILLPYTQMTQLEQIDYNYIRRNLSLQVEKILTKSENKEVLSSTWKFEHSNIEDIQLNEVTTSITLQGMRDTEVCVTVDEKLIYHLISIYGLQLKYKGSNIKIINEAVTLFTEDVVKRVAQELKGPRQTVFVHPAKVVSASALRTIYDSKDLLVSSLDMSEGKLTLMIVNNSRVIGD